MSHRVVTQAEKEAVVVPRALVVGCGNASRRDDGVGLYVVRGIARALGLPETGPADEVRMQGTVAAGAGSVGVELRFEQQMDICLADELQDVDLLVAVDAHAGGAHPEIYRRVELQPGYETSLTSHHLTPDTLAGLSMALHGRAPRTLSISIRGFDFDFGEEITPQTREAADRAIAEILELLQQEVAK